MLDTRKEADDQIPEVRLWNAVLLQAIEDWRFGPWKTSQAAAAFLFQDQEDFEMVCQAAGLNAASLREKLARMPKRQDVRPFRAPLFAADVCPVAI